MNSIFLAVAIFNRNVKLEYLSTETRRVRKNFSLHISGLEVNGNESEELEEKKVFLKS
jgi:hypothetical protein